jgi:hypothetical protein
MRLVWLQMDMNIKQMWRISACMIFLLGLHIKKDVGGFIWRSAEGTLSLQNVCKKTVE